MINLTITRKGLADVKLSVEKLTDLIGTIFSNDELNNIGINRSNESIIHVSKSIPKNKLKELIPIANNMGFAIATDLETDWVSSSSAGYKTISKRLELGLLEEANNEAWEQYCKIIDIGILFKTEMAKFMKDHDIKLEPGIYLKTKKTK